MKFTRGVGYNSKGRHKHLVDGKYTHVYGVWQGMIRRCYDSKLHIVQPTYIDCSVVESWKDFQNFADWFEKQPYNDVGYHLDKDILIKDNKVYGPKTCVFIPQQINNLFTNGSNVKGKYPTGVTITRHGNFKARVGLITGERKYLGTFNTAQEAYNAYKIAKEMNVKAVANFWKDKIDEKVYNALMNWELTE